MQRMHPLRAQAGQGEQRDGARRHLVLQLLQQRQPAAARDGGDLAGEVRADAGQRIEILAGRQHVADRARQPLDQPRGTAIGAHPERVGPFDIQQVGQPFELGGDLGVDQGHGDLRRPRQLGRIDVAGS